MYESRNRVAVSPSPREARDGWVLDAVFANGKQAAIAGFSTESEANSWLGSARHVTWLRDTRTSFCWRSAVAMFDRLGSCVSALSELASVFFQSICHRWRAIEAVRVGSRRIGTTAQLHASAWLPVASNLARRLRKRLGAESGSSFRHRTVYRRLLAATVALLILVAVLRILLAVAMTPGERPARLSPGTTQFIADRPTVPPHSSDVTETSDPIALLIERVSSSQIAVERPTEAAAGILPPQSAGDDGPAGDIHAATARHDLRPAASPAIVGVWAPETGSCSAREDVLPAIISERGARAGETSCVFKERTLTERGWRVLAKCTNGHEHWTSNVRLFVTGDRLVWTSKRGTQAYKRCRSNI
jgi:hypothetical protein